MLCAKRNIFQVILTSFFFFQAFSGHSQNVFSSEEDLKKQANKLFEEEEFAKAYPLFSQLLSLYPKDPQYNYRFGTCLMYSTSDKGKAIPYIEYGAKRQTQGVDKEVFFYLGKAYHLNYRFADAVRLYSKYKSVASAKQVQKYDVDRQIEMCENGRKLLKTVTDLAVYEKKEISVADFFRSYNLSEFNAKIVIKPDDLKSSIDKKKKDESIMYLAPDRNTIYYSSYGEDGKNGRDIYYVTRTSSGDLSKPVRLNDVINTKYDEDYVFFHPDGKTLYFCSKGHNSMGGYDIFRSEWNSGTQSWGKPVNMDFPINTPDDDILFISDSEDKTAYFSSRRESADGSIMVYKIRLERKPLDIAIITGVLKKETGDKIPKAVITVSKVLKNEVVGVYNTNSADGSYTLSVPNGGKFVFAVESFGFKKSSELVIIPSQQEIVPLRQEILLVNENGSDKVIIKNSFDAQIDSADLALATQYIKAKASLEVSPPEQEVTPVAVEETTIAVAVPKTETKTAPVTNDDIIAIAYDDSKQTQKEANELRKNSDAAQQLANRKNQLSLEKNKEATELMKSADAISNQQEKLAQIDKAAKLRKEADELSQDAAVLLTIANQMDAQAKAMQQQADAELKYAKDLDNAIKAGASEKKMNDLLLVKEALDKKSDELKATQSVIAEMIRQADEKQTEANKATAKYIDVQQDVEDLQKEAKRLRAEADKTKNDGVKQNLISQAGEMEKEAEEKKKQADEFSSKAKILQAEADSLKSNATLASAVIKEIENTSAATTAAVITASQPKTTAVSSAVVNEPKTETPPANTQPLKITSPYVDVFVKQMYEAEKIQSELDKQQALAVIYQSWTDSLDNQIALLKSRMAAVTTEADKKYVQNKIYELESSVDDKRQRAADSRSKVDNLKLQQALADASGITPETTSVNTVTETTSVPAIETASVPVSAENLQGTNNINSFYENKLKEAAKEPNEYVKASKEQEIYTDWAASLYDESQRLKKDGKGGKAGDAEKASKEKQSLAMQAGDRVTTLKAEHPEWVEAAKTQTPAASVSSETHTDPSSVSTISETTATTTTVAVSNSVPTETVTASAPETTSVKTESSAVLTHPALSTIPPENVKNKDEYTHFAALKNESDWAKKNSERQYKQAEEMQNISNEQQRESERLLKQSESETDPGRKQVLLAQSESLQKRSLRNQAKADSLRLLAKNSEQEANSKRTESDLYLQSLDKTAYEEITAATGYKPAVSETAATVNEPAATSMVTASVPETTSVAETASVPTSTVSATETVNTETTAAKTESAQPESSSSAAKTETQTSTAASVPSSTQTESASEIKTETAPAASSEMAMSSSKTETIPGPSTGNSAPPAAEMMRYYDELFDRIELSSASSYSSAKPIPVNPPMPEGLVFKVQIGAFRNPIPQDLFKGIKPITAETTPQGFRRYTAGLFQKFSAATAAKKQVNDLGYRDAFVVAFYNGKRISMNEAIAKAKENGETIDVAAAASVSTGTSVSASQVSESGISFASATDVKSVSGLFYTVQIGVFSKPMTSFQLYNISPLNSERTDNGLIRYTTGRFDDEAKAVRSKNNIAGKGVSDAFVVAYYNGKRISLSAAKAMIDSEGGAVLAKDKQEYSFVPSDTTTSESSSAALAAASNKGIIFNVQVGAYRDQVPIEDANKLLKLSRKGIKTFKDENGLMVYAVGEFLEYESANSMKAQMVNEGFAGAFVIAFKDGIKMSAAAALDLLKNR